MSRTTRTDRRFRRNAARDGQGFCCPGGKSCNVCMDNRRWSIVRGSTHQAEDISAWLFDPTEEPVRADGGEDDWGHWGTAIGSDPDCGCESCSEVWADLAWPLLRSTRHYGCRDCGGQCVYD